MVYRQLSVNPSKTLSVIAVGMGRSRAEVQMWEIIATVLFATPTIAKMKRSRAVHEH